MSIITATQDDLSCTFFAQDGENLLAALRRAGFFLSADCGGSGRCQKCLVTLCEKDGKRQVLACRTLVSGNATLLLPPKNQKAALAPTLLSTPLPFTARQGLGLAVDLGTTTVAAALYDLSCGTLLAEGGEFNAQRSYGADVISRVQFVNETPDGLSALSELVRSQIAGLAHTLCGKAEQPVCAICEVFVAGNTIMQHILSSIDPSSIAVSPFLPQSLFREKALFYMDALPHAAVSLSPCVSGYVGGDITAGLLACGLAAPCAPTLFLDIGTNGEMALCANGQILCCSVACGPAFEGGEISCGSCAAEGAVAEVSWQEDALSCKTVSGCAKSICGSGLVDLLAVLLTMGGIEESGLLLPPSEAPLKLKQYLTEDENGNGLLFLNPEKTVFLSAKDVRRLQLAKAAVAAGIDVLLAEAKISADELDRIMIAGGFGGHLNLSNAVRIGLLPRGAESKTAFVGNSSLRGAAMALLLSDAGERLSELAGRCSYLELSAHTAFGERFVERMPFDEE